MSCGLNVLGFKFLTINHRILKEKLLFFHHLKFLPKNAISYQILQIQQDQNLPSILDDIVLFLNRHEITDVTLFSKKDWKTFVSDAIHSENRDFLINSSQKYKKIDHLTLACETYEMKSYFSDLTLAQARLQFRRRLACISS